MSVAVVPRLAVLMVLAGLIFMPFGRRVRVLSLVPGPMLGGMVMARRVPRLAKATRLPQRYEKHQEKPGNREEARHGGSRF